MVDVDSHGRGCHRYRYPRVVVGPSQKSSAVWSDQATTQPILRLSAWAMSRLRPSPTPTLPTSTRPLRVVGVGTLFLTHTLSLPSHPGPTQTIRAHEYVRARGGSAPSVLCVLSQLNADKCWLVASLGGAQEARVVTRELEAEGVSTRYCKVWEGAGVPAAWLLHAGEFPDAVSGRKTHLCFVLFFPPQATRTVSLSSTTIHYQIFHMKSLYR